MPKPLAGAWSLIADTWKFFLDTWNQTTKISIWFLYFGLADFACNVGVKFFPPLAWLLLLLDLAFAVVSLWVSLRLMLVMLKLEQGQTPSDAQGDADKAWKLIWPLALVAIFQTLIMFGCFLLFIVPGIYFAIVLSFSQICLVDQDKRGMQALAASRDLVRGRWWAVLWRELAGMLFFGIGLLALLLLIFMLLGLVTGQARMLMFLQSPTPDPLFSGTTDLIQSMLQAAFIPLFLGFNIKLYRLLQKTKNA